MLDFILDFIFFEYVKDYRASKVMLR